MIFGLIYLQQEFGIGASVLKYISATVIKSLGYMQIFDG